MSRRPTAFLHAIAAAAPLCEPVAFHQAGVRLRRECVGTPANCTLAVAEDARRRMRRHGGGRSLRELDLIRERAWFGGSGEPLVHDVHVLDPLCRLAASLLDWNERQLCLREVPTRPRWAALEPYRWATLALPWDLLGVALAGMADGGPASRTSVRHRSVCALQRPDLFIGLAEDKDVHAEWAEGHLHLANAAEYSWLWVGLMIDATCGRLSLEDLQEDPATPRGKRLDFEDLLAEAAAVRTLFVWLAQGEGRTLRDAVAELSRAHQKHWRYVERLWTGAIPPDHQRRARALCSDGLQPWLREWRGSPPAGALKDFGDLLVHDVASTMLDSGIAENAEHAEHAVLEYAMREARQCATGGSPTDLARIAMGYLRVFAWTYRYVVQEPGVGGLTWFGRHYERITALARPLERIRHHAASRLSSKHVNLAVMEVRSTPKNIRGKLRDMPIQPDRMQGLVAHFVRKRPDRADWHSGWLDAARPWADDLHAVISTMGEMSASGHLWGIDAANDELAMPPWVEAVVIYRAFCGGERGAPRKPVHLTMHAGEEYRTPMEGLRRVDAALSLRERIAGHTGGKLRIRIGHGLALLDHRDPRDSVVLQPAFERFTDLWWEIRLARTGRVILPQARLEAVVRDFERLGGDLSLDKLPGMSSGVEALLHLVDRLHDPREVFRIHGRSSHSQRISDPLAALLGNNALARLAELPVEVHLETDSVAAARRAVWSRLLEADVVIEANPSSNLVVADMTSLGDHPMYLSANARLRVSINDDDPLTFATCLADERAYAFAGAIQNGMTVPEAARWLDARRVDGMNGRFGSDG